MAKFLAELGQEALAKGVTGQTFAAATSDLTMDPDVLAAMGNQLEHERTAADYLALLVSDTRVETGRQKLAEHSALLSEVEKRFGVDRHVVLAIWGVETSYGARMGDKQIIRSLATLSLADQRRPQFWRAELIAALRILQSGDVAQKQMTGSWAGAMGHTQFMPTTYLAHAADLDGDGKRDIWSNPGDALASAANYLKASGWSPNMTWGFEVVLPAGFDYGHSAPGRTKRLPEWQALGLARPAGEAWPAAPKGELRLLLPAGARGPAFLVTGNFRAILRYNASVAYALAVGLLADRIAGRGGVATAWPADERALVRAEREELQAILSALGHATGGIDGIVGGGTREAIRAYQRTKGLPEDGHPSATLLERLRADRRN